MRASPDTDSHDVTPWEAGGPAASWAGAAPLPGPAPGRPAEPAQDLHNPYRPHKTLTTPTAPKGPLVRALQRDLIPRLAKAWRPSLAQLTPHDVEAFTVDLLQGSEPALVARLDALRQRGFTAEVLCLDLLAPAARRLGDLWNDDRCDFTSVTIGVSQLQRLMRLLGAHWVPSLGDPGAGLSVLLMQPPQEQHSFGLAMVAEFFRCAGWDVAGGPGDLGARAAARAQAQHFDVVGFSVGAEMQLPWLRQEVAAVRLASRNPDVVIMVGGPLFALQPQRAAELGVELCVASAHQAPWLAAQRVRAGQLA